MTLPDPEEDDAPLVRSVTCEKERGFVLDGAHYCIHCQRLANRATCIEKVKWWSDKIKLCEVLCEKATGISCRECVDLHESYDATSKCELIFKSPSWQFLIIFRIKLAIFFWIQG